MIFIRPWILLLLFMPLLFYWGIYHAKYTSSWAKWVDKKLLPYLLMSNGSTGGRKRRYSLLVVLWTAFVVAAAGPAFQKRPVPVSASLPNTVIIFDLGPSMQGQTLASAKIKLHDLVTALKGNRIGLVLYADKGYTALPLTEDRGLLRSLIASLDSSVLPNTIQRPAAGFEKANELIAQTGGKGRILYLTAGGADARGIASSYPVGVLGLDDAAISSSLKQLGAYQAKTVDASDIFALLQATEPETAVQFDMQEQSDEWADLGGLIALCLLPFFVLTFRRGWLFVLLLVPYGAQASLFLRPDQENYQQHKQAVANYRKGNYDKAIQGFQMDPYNLGNALAYAGKIQEAIAAYGKAIEKNPNDEDAVFNKEYLEKQLPPPEKNPQDNPQQDEQNSSGSQQQENEQPDQQKESDGIEQDQQESQQEDQQRSEENEQQEAQPKSDETLNNESQNDSNENSLSEQEQAEQTQPQEVDEADREQQPFNQEGQQILNRLRSDPYRVLRYRILQQARQK